MSQDALGLLKHLKTARARWPFPDGITDNYSPTEVEVDVIGTFPEVVWRSIESCPNQGLTTLRAKDR